MSTAVISQALPYERRLDQDPEWALSEGSRHLDERSAVHQSLVKITRKLTELGIPYSVAGGMALFRHGFRRFTEDVHLLVSKEGLARIHRELEGRGYLRVFAGSKNLRDTETGVRIEFLIAGQFPGDGKPKEVAFPEPDTASVSIDGTNYLSLPNLVELKLASGMTNSERLKDLGDVQELIKLLNLPRNFAEQLRPYVRGKYDELWKSTTGQLKRYYLLWRNKFLTADAQSLPDMAETLRRAADQLQAMINDGIVLDPDQETGNDYAYLMTTDPQIARKYGMHEASEFFDLTNDDE